MAIIILQRNDVVRQLMKLTLVIKFIQFITHFTRFIQQFIIRFLISKDPIFLMDSIRSFYLKQMPSFNCEIIRFISNISSCFISFNLIY